MVDTLGIDLQIDVLLLAAKFIPFVPSIASNIQTWVITNINLSNDQFEIYNEKLTGGYIIHSVTGINKMALAIACE